MRITLTGPVNGTTEEIVNMISNALEALGAPDGTGWIGVIEDESEDNDGDDN